MAPTAVVPTAVATAMAPMAEVPTAVATAMVPTVVAPTVTVVAMVAIVIASTVVPTITVDTAVPAMKRCQLDSHLAAAASVTTYHHSHRQHLIAATTDLYSKQVTEETESPLRLRMGATRMEDISVVLFPPLSVARNRVLVPLLMSCTSLSHVMSAVFASKRPGATTVIGDSGA